MRFWLLTPVFAKLVQQNVFMNEEAFTAQVDAWSVFTRQDFPKYSLRTKSSSQLCDASVNQKTGYLDSVDDSHVHLFNLVLFLVF